MQLGVLDQIPIRSGDTAGQAISETFQLAEACDRLGYTRYWLAEHHNAGIAGLFVARDSDPAGGRAYGADSRRLRRDYVAALQQPQSC